MNIAIKKVLLLTLLLSTCSFALSSHYHPVRIETGLTFPITFGHPKMKGVGIVLEPKLNIFNRLSLGGRIEIDIMGGVSGEDTFVSAGVLAFTSTLFKGEFFFSTSDIRPFIGFGAGGYYIGGFSGGVSIFKTSQKALVRGYYFGIAPQIGINIGSLRGAIGYNMIFGEQETGALNNDKGIREKKLISILSFEVSWSIMGKRKR